MRYFFSSGEASGELAAVALAQAIGALDPAASFEGIGAARMRDAGFALWRDHTGWASMGPFEAIPRIPKLLMAGWATAAHIAASKPDLVVLVDFGAFNLRLAAMLRRRFGYGGPILDLFPPATWLDSARSARAVAASTIAVTAFAHQRDFYHRLGLPIEYFGHPLAGRYHLRAPRPAPPVDGGRVALLPGSRPSELKYHIPRLLDAYGRLRERRPHLAAVAAAADDAGERALRAAIARAGADIAIARGVTAALTDADAAWVASGTAVLETVLSGVPAVALYVNAPILVAFGRRVYSGKYIALPNIVMDRIVVPEFLQDDATAQRLAETMDGILRDPGAQYAQFAELRERLGPVDALVRCAQFAVELAAKPPA
jgi:lipid-A-disaccharide synthase